MNKRKKYVYSGCQKIILLSDCITAVFESLLNRKYCVRLWEYNAKCDNIPDFRGLEGTCCVAVIHSTFVGKRKMRLQK